MNTESPEDIIRKYLIAVENPQQLVDQSEVKHLTALYEDQTDPIEKLRVLTALNRARTPDIALYRAGFVEHARKWAEENDIPFATFEQMGIDRHVLVEARLVPGSKRGNRSSTPKNGSVSTTTIKEKIDELAEVFTMADIATQIGGSPMTVRKAISELIGAGKITNLGPVGNHPGRGRAPHAFRKAS